MQAFRSMSWPKPRRAILALSLVTAFALLVQSTSPAVADGGAGGSGSGAGGAGGTGFTGNPGSNGSCGGGGGGGAGGGNGGNALTCVFAAGGSGGTASSPNGADGSNGSFFGGGGGGGGGGYNGNGAGAATLANSSALTGGNGGRGGDGIEFLSGGGGGGGAGGYGAIVTGAGASSNFGTITGGNGGDGGNASFRGGGSGGDGGVGVQFTSTGAIFTNAGTVIGGNGGTGGTGSIPGNPGAGGAGIVGGGMTIINSGTISGGLSGDGVTRANAVSFTGGTNILELQGGYNVIGNVVAFSSADTLRLGGVSSASFDVSQIGAQYLGFGIFEKTGSSTWTLTGTNADALPWAINAGTLAVNGTMANSTMTVNSGGTLAGTGTVGNVIVANGGVFAPGAGTPGTSMTVAGNLAFQSGALYVVQLNPTSASSANVSGTATLTGGSVQAVLAPGSYVSRQYTILHADGGLGGSTFSGVTLSGVSLPNFSTTLSYTPTDVLLNLTAATLGAGTSLNQNQQNIAGAINNFFNSGGALPPSFASVFGLTGGNLANALSQLSGEVATGAQQGAFQLMTQFLGVMLDPFVDGRGGVGSGPALGFAREREALSEDVALAYAKAMKAPAYKAAPVTFEQRWTAWAAAYGGYNKTSGDPLVTGSHDLIARAGGFVAGLDYHVTRDTVVGLALAGGGTSWSLSQGLGGGRSDAFQAGVYAATRSGPAYLAASLAFANHWMSTDRFAPFGDHLTASFNAQSFGGRVESGYRLATPVGGVAPYAALQAQSFRTPAYSEIDVTGGGFGLTYNSRSATDTRSELGVRFDKVAAVDPTAVLTLRGRLAWAHDWVSDHAIAAAFQTLPGASFIVNGATPATDSGLVSAGAELRLANGVTLLGKVDGELARHSTTYAGTGTLRVSW
jgi:uncharacterized protein with beta-barrel porin domain